MNPYVRLMMETQRENEFKMPPVGITETKFQLGGVVYVRYTVRCDVEGCWLMVQQATKEKAEKFLAEHKEGKKFPSGERGWPECPAPPARESLPSGYKYIDKLWFELDDTLDKIFELKSSTDYNIDDSIALGKLRGYCEGLAFSIVMLDTGLWPNKSAVAAEGLRRSKIRKGEIEYSPTPSRHRGDMLVKDVQPTGVSSEPAKSVAPPSRPSSKAAPKQIAPSVVTGLKAAHSSGIFSTAELAKMFNLTEAEVKKITG